MTTIAKEERAKWLEQLSEKFIVEHPGSTEFMLTRLFNALEAAKARAEKAITEGEKVGLLLAEKLRLAEAERDALVKVLSEYQAPCEAVDWDDCPEFERCLEGDEPYDSVSKCWKAYAEYRAARGKKP